MQGKTNACCITIRVRVDIQTDFIRPQIAQQICKNNMRLVGQALPIRFIVAPKLFLNFALVPIFQRTFQEFFSLIAAVLAIDGFKPVFQRAPCFGIKCADQCGLPIVPSVWANAANIAHRQNGQQIQTFGGLNSLGKIPYCARIGDITFLRHIRHQQMIADQPFNGVHFFLRQAKPRCNLARDFCPQD